MCGEHIAGIVRKDVLGAVGSSDGDLVLVRLDSALGEASLDLLDVTLKPDPLPLIGHHLADLRQGEENAALGHQLDPEALAVAAQPKALGVLLLKANLVKQRIC